MKKTEVNICDVCNKIVTEKTCEICDKDLCKVCEENMGVGLANGGILFLIISCKSCAEKLEQAKLKQYFENDPHRKIRKDLLKVFRNAIVVENLQDREEKEADRGWLLSKIRRGDPFVEVGRTEKINPWGPTNLIPLKGGMLKKHIK